jgi:putative tricarboxylic transport membrane protein
MAFQDPADRSAGENGKRTGFNREICAGLFLIAAAALGYYAAYPLDAGSMSGVGSGLMPKSVAVGTGLFGVYLIATGLMGSNERIDGFSLRGTVFILGAIIAFAMTVRPYGLLVAGPLAMLISSMADPDTRPVEILIYTICMTASCYLLFKVVLRLPIPAMPPLLGY